ncbi:hypothetical protein BpHYR1_050306 [Brachionus plicatilis]|uniref:Uncharacterized protein n=1 Tax=Brachionus plicatilis TaxID=10195 RepID=A0A3M7PZ70_BRAPC|nr:hypothetical protein BpHYR1_050306 [Brachionus plicatilis]
MAQSLYQITTLFRLNDWHLPIFRAVQEFTEAKRVLYPGSYKHISPSLFLPNVTYNDFDIKMKQFFDDEEVLKWVENNKFYKEEAKIKFINQDFNQIFEELNSFDLMISSCAGIVSKECSKYLKVGGYFLVSDAHSDARATFLMPEFSFEAVFDSSKKILDFSDTAKCGHFITTQGNAITQIMVEESIRIPRSKRKFKIQKEEIFLSKIVTLSKSNVYLEKCVNSIDKQNAPRFAELVKYEIIGADQFHDQSYNKNYGSSRLWKQIMGTNLVLGFSEQLF